MQDIDKRLLMAVRLNDVDEARRLIDAGADIDMRLRWPVGRDQPTIRANLLCEALLRDFRESTDLLMDLGIKANDPLTMECACGSKITTGEMIDALMAAGCDPSHRYLSGNTYLHFAENEDVVKALLKAGVPVDARNEKDETALMWAAKEGRLGACIALIDGGADAGALNLRQETALHLLADCRRDSLSHEELHAGKITALLISEGAKVDAIDSLGQTALHLAASTNNVQCAVILLGAGASCEMVDKRGYTPADLAMKEEIKALFVAHRERMELSSEAFGGAEKTGMQSRRRI